MAKSQKLTKRQKNSGKRKLLSPSKETQEKMRPITLDSFEGLLRKTCARNSEWSLLKHGSRIPTEATNPIGWNPTNCCAPSIQFGQEISVIWNNDVTRRQVPHHEAVPLIRKVHSGHEA